jgi:hypothetical protein
MSNSFNVSPIWLDTDTSTAANTNWRGTSGCTLAGVGSRGIKPTRIMVLPAVSVTAITAGLITISDPQSSTVLLAIPIVLPAAAEPFDSPADLAGTNGDAGFCGDGAIDCY